MDNQKLLMGLALFGIIFMLGSLNADVFTSTPDVGQLNMNSLGKQLTITKHDGIQEQYFNVNLTGEKTCFFPKETMSVSSPIVQNLRAYLFKDNVQTGIVEPADFEKESEAGNLKKICYDVNTNIYDKVRFGESSTIVEYQDQNIINYVDDWYNVSVALLQNVAGQYDSLIQDIWVFNYAESYKFGANKTGVNETWLGEFMYRIESDVEIQQHPIIPHIKRVVSVAPSVMGGQATYENHYFDFSDICSREFHSGINASCEQNYYEVFHNETNTTTYYLEVTFNSDKNIDPTITSDFSTLATKGLFSHTNTRSSDGDGAVALNQSLAGSFINAKPIDLGSAWSNLTNVSINNSHDFNIDSDVLGFWRFEEGSGTTAYDESSFNNDGTITNAVFNSSSKVGDYAMSFDGNNDYVTISSSNLPNVSDAKTLLGWVKFHGTHNNQVPFCLYQTDLGQEQFCYNQWTNTYSTIEVNGGFPNYYRRNNLYSFATDTWFLIAIRYDGTGNHTGAYGFSINGGKWLAPTITNGELPNVSTSSITHLTMGGGAGAFFNGSIDSVMVINRSLTNQEIADLYNATKDSYIEDWTNATITNIRVSEGNVSDNYSPRYEGDENKVNLTGLVGFWNMDNTTQSGNATAIFDTSGNGNDGNLLNQTACRNVTGFIDTGCEFDGDGDKIMTGAWNITNDEITMSAWINPTTDANGVIVGKSASAVHGGNYYQFLLLVTPTDKIDVRIDATTTGTATNSLKLNQWNHVVGVYNGSDIRIYLDGVLINTPESKTGNILASTQNVVIGGRDTPTTGDAEFFNGTIDQVMIYNRSLTASEVTTLYETSALKYGDWVSPTTQGLARFVQFNTSLISSSQLFSEYVGNVSIGYIEDNTYPLISFGDNTEATGTYFPRNWIYANVSVTELNQQNITFTLYNSTDLVNRTTFFTDVRNINWTGLTDDVYTYNVSVVDIANQVNITESRNITLDNVAPVITILSPLDDVTSQPVAFQTTLNEAGTCLYTLDSNPLANMSTTINVSFEDRQTLNIGTHTISFTCQDYATNPTTSGLVIFFVKEPSGGGAGGTSGTSTTISKPKINLSEMEVNVGDWFVGFENDIEVTTIGIDGEPTDVNIINIELLGDIIHDKQIYRKDVGEYGATFFIRDRNITSVEVKVTASQGSKILEEIVQIELQTPSKVQEVVEDVKNFFEKIESWIRENLAIAVGILAIFVFLIISLIYLKELRKRR